MATRTNIVIDQGTTFSTTLNLTDDYGSILNLNGYTANSQIRRSYTSSNAISFNVSINVSNGTIVLNMGSDLTKLLIHDQYVYDVVITNTASNTTSRIVQGIVDVMPYVTR